MGMLTNYSKVAIRNIKKNKVQAAIKVGGFSIGIAISLLICLFVLGEMKKDQHLSSSPVYKVLYESKRPEHSYKSSSAPPVLAPSMKQDYPDVEESGRILVFDGFGDAGGNLFRPSEAKTSVYETKFGYADQSILSLLQFELLHGDANTALLDPNTLIISERKANKYFKDKNPVGQTVFINENMEKPYKVGGVFKKFG